MAIRRVDNPPNPYLAAQREWLEEPPAIALQVFEEKARSIVSENDSPDLPFRYSVNPYRGCQHACAYCYARATHEYLGLGAGTDFDSKIIVKTNAAELLRAALARKSWRRESIAFSGVTDCYQPLEVCYRLTRRLLEVCHEFCTPVGLVTKSFLVARDADLLSAMQQGAGARVFFSIAFADDALARRVEPAAPPPSRRFEAMRRLRDAGVDLGLMFAPLIPGLNDREIPRVLALARACGARSAGYVPLRLSGSVRDVFLARMRETLPERATRVELRIRDMRGGALNDARFGARMRGQGEYWHGIQQLFELSARRLGLETWSDAGKCTKAFYDPRAALPQAAGAASPGAAPLLGAAADRESRCNSRSTRAQAAGRTVQLPLFQSDSP